MKRYLLLILSFYLCGIGQSAGALIVQRTTTAIFHGALEGIHSDDEPLIHSVTRDGTTAILHLGNYSDSDIGVTRTFTRSNSIPSEWDATNDVWRRFPIGPSFNLLWFGLDAPIPGQFGVPGLPVGFPTFNFLQKVDVTLNAYSRWYDQANTYRSAWFTVTAVTIIPEPSTSVLLQAVALSSALFGIRRHRR